MICFNQDGTYTDEYKEAFRKLVYEVQRHNDVVNAGTLSIGAIATTNTPLKMFDRLDALRKKIEEFQDLLNLRIEQL